LHSCTLSGGCGIQQRLGWSGSAAGVCAARALDTLMEVDMHSMDNGGGTGAACRTAETLPSPAQQAPAASASPLGQCLKAPPGGTL
jgi:hypothetical protein